MTHQLNVTGDRRYLGELQQRFWRRYFCAWN